MTHQQPLPDDLAGELVLKLTNVYGRRFLAIYEHLTPHGLRRMWANELAGVSEAGIRYAIDHLPPDYAPNPLQIRQLAANRPETGPKALPAPQVPPERVRRHLERLNGLRVGPQPQRDPVAWAQKIVDNPQGKTITQLAMAWEALRAKGRVK